MELAEEAAMDQRKASISLWNITLTYNVLQPDTSRGLVSQALSHLSSLSIKDLYQVISEFQSSAVGRVGKGYTGREPGHRIWTFSSSLMFSMAIFTTIGQSYIISLLTFNTVSSSSSQIIVRLRFPSSEDSYWKDSEHILRSIGDPHHAPIQRYYWLNSGHQFQVSLHEAL